MEGRKISDKPIQGQILIVDDDKEARGFLMEFLQCIGFSDIATAGSGKEALRHLEKSSPRLVLLDYKLPDLDGSEVLRRIKQKHPDLPVIMMTAYPNVAGMEKIVQQGAFDLVVKPLDLRYLEQTVVTGFAS